MLTVETHIKSELEIAVTARGNIGPVDHFQLGIINDTAPQFTIKEKRRFRNKSNTA